MSKEKENPVVQQSLTTESVVKENLTSEQRARETPNLYTILEKIDFEDRCKRVHSFAVRSNSDYVTTQGIFGIVQEVFEKVDDAFRSRDEEVKELREALKELTDKTNMLTYSIAFENREVNKDFFAETMDALAKAKQLLKEK